ncbi:MAG TPA: CRISPR-associated protein Csx19 [Caldilineaceae bacterium]|nr:CRISPR-associated protein Csx19 [Caldilineaceae bacterium]
MTYEKQRPRRIERTALTITPATATEIGNDPLVWLKGKARSGMILLIHTDEVVLWGRFDGDFHFPPQALYAHQPIRPFTIQSARAFDREQETYLWQVGEGQWCARTVVDGATAEKPDTGIATGWRRMDEEQVLWGTRVEASTAGFSRVADGLQGLVHAPPLTLREAEWGGERQGNMQRHLRLQIRHYLEEDKVTGWLRIAFSRLVGIYANEPNGTDGEEQRNGTVSETPENQTRGDK